MFILAVSLNTLSTTDTTDTCTVMQCTSLLMITADMA